MLLIWGDKHLDGAFSYARKKVNKVAKITIPKQIPPTSISVFSGLNESSDGDTELKLGEASKQIGWRVTDGMKLKRMEGYATLFPSLGAGVIQGQWYGSVAGVDVHLFAHAGNIYKRVAGVNTIIGTMTDAKTSFFFFQEKIYILNGHEYKYWDGTTFANVVGYRPRIAIATPPAGGGTLFEEINRLTGAKHQTFSPDGTATVYQLAEIGITLVDFVNVNGVLKTVGTDYTVDTVNGKVTFTVAPTGGVPDSVDIGWTKGTGDRTSILQNMFATIYGGANDSRVWVYGGSNNILYYSGLADGVPSAEYFPANAYDEVGSDEFAVTGAVRQYDKLLIFTEKGSYYTSYDTTTLANGTVIPLFPLFQINSTRGNVAPGQAKNIMNNPFTVYQGVYEWSLVQLGVDVRNAVYLSRRVQPSLDLVDLSQAVTFDYEHNREYWLVVGSIAWIYNYGVDAWYKRENIPASNFIEIDGSLYFGTDGTIMKFDPLLLTDNGAIINTVWEMGFFDFGAEYLNKYMNNVWISIKPEIRSSLDVQTETNNDGISDIQPIEYSLYDFEDCHFDDFSFNTTYNPQPFYIEVQCMGFDYFKLILSNSAPDYDATVLSINLPARLGGKVR